MSASFVDITPKEPAPLAGFGSRKGPFTSVASTLEANLTALPSESGWLILVSIDTLFASSRLVNAIESEVRLSTAGDDLDRVVVVASHTHYAPSLDPTKPKLGAVDDHYFAEVTTLIAQRVVELLSHERPPADISIVSGSAICANNVLRRRRLPRWSRRILGRSIAMAPNRSKPVRHDLDIVMLRDDRGVRAVLWSWPCHAVNAPATHAVSADFPGEVRRALRVGLGEPQLPVLYLPGFAGDQRAGNTHRRLAPRSLVVSGFRESFAPNTELSFRELCDDVSAAAFSAIDSACSAEIDDTVEVRTVSVPLCELIDGVVPDGSFLPMDVHSIRCGTLELLLLGAEVCEPYYQLLRAERPGITVMSGYCNQVFGYLPSNLQVNEGGYEVAGFMPWFSLPGRLRDDVETPIVQAVRGFE